MHNRIIPPRIYNPEVNFFFEFKKVTAYIATYKVGIINNA